MIPTTTISETPTTDLAHAFEHLKQTARSLDDLYNWFMDHPKALVGDMILPADYKMSLRLGHYSSGLLAHVAQKGSLPVPMVCEITAPYKPSALLQKETTTDEVRPAVYFKHSQNMELDLLDWPLATALLVADGIDVLDEYKKFEHFEQYAAHVDAGLAHHFGDFTLDKLKNLYEADLLPKDKHDIVIVPALIEMLYSTRKTNVVVSMPMEMS